MQADELTQELNASFSTIVHLQVFSIVIQYQHLADALGQNPAWTADRLREHALTVQREAPGLQKPQFGEAYAEKLMGYADQVAEHGADDGQPNLTLIMGGKDAEPGAD